MVLPFNVALYSGVSVAALFAAAGAADAYAVGGNSPEFVADFAGVLNSGTEYYRSGGSDTTFSSVFTHSGLVAPATMTDSDGSLKWAPHNTLLRSSELDNASWIKFLTSVTANQDTAPDGTMSADLIVDTVDNNAHRIFQTSSVNFLGVANNFRVWLKPAGRTWVYLQSANGVQCFFNLSGSGSVGTASGTGVVGGTISYNSSSGYYLCTLQLDASNLTSNGCRIGLSTGDGVQVYAGDGSSGVYAWGAHCYRTDLGGMVNNPDRGDSYVPTTTAARFLPRRNNYIYNGSSWEKAGILIEPAAATNLLLNSGTLSTQSVTVTAVAHTLSFTGTGTITLSGASTAGPLVGTGTGENNRVSLTFTPSAGSLTCTVSGTVTNAQLEVGSVPTSYIPTAGSTVTRAAETLTVAGSSLPANTTGVSVQMQGRMTYADLGTEAQRTFWRWYNGASDFLLCDLDTDGADTGEVNANQSDTTGGAGTVAIDAYSPGINVAYNIASRHSNTDISLAVDGTAGTADATPTALHDASSDTFQVAHNLQGTVGMLRVWGVGLSDTDLESAT